MRTTTAILAVLVTAVSSGALGHEIKAKSLQIDHPWVRVTPKGAAVTAGYLTITNTGKTADFLIGASLEGAGGAEIHQTIVENGFAKMRPMPGGVERLARAKRCLSSPTGCTSVRKASASRCSRP